MGDFIGVVALAVLAFLAVCGMAALTSDTIVLGRAEWECIEVLPATEVSEKAKCLTYRRINAGAVR